MYFQSQKREDRTIDENCVYSDDFGENFAQPNVMKVIFGMNLSPNCASNTGKNEDHDTLSYGNHTGICKNRITQGDVTLFISQEI